MWGPPTLISVGPNFGGLPGWVGNIVHGRPINTDDHRSSRSVTVTTSTLPVVTQLEERMAKQLSTALCLWYLSAVTVRQNLLAVADDVDEDARLGTADVIRKYGYKAEVHKVTTEDGYILEVDRIPVASETNTSTRMSPILLLHGVQGNAANWVANLPSQSPGYLIADAGFDVWLLNQRGVPESNFHKTLTTDDEEFWQWSFDEIGRYDVPAVVDHILNVTGSSKVGLLGTSQGFTNALVFLSMCPEYNDKVNILIGYAPVANLTHFTSMARFITPFAEVIQAVNDVFTNGGFLVSSQQQKNVIATVCNSPLRDLCYAPLALLFGRNLKQLNGTRIPVYLANAPAGTSTQDIVHFVQITPPAYPLEKIQVPVALFRGKADLWADPRDIDDLVQTLHHVIVSDVTVPDPRFGHLDFVFASFSVEL
ncbi:gastric triacylglycerol lipase-like [Haemaphysalis longicornis]